MSLLNSIRDAYRNWRGRRGPDKTRVRTRPRATVGMEHLDHRRLLAVNFTGAAATDIPDSTAPGFAIVRDDNPVPIRNPQLNELIRVSGFDIDAIRLRYTPEDDILSVAIQQPPNQKTTPQFPVIAGDADNNGDGGTVDPAVRLVQPLFQDFPTLGGSETMGVFLDLNNDFIPDVVAGIPNTPGVGKLYTVSTAVTSPDPMVAATTAPGFGAPLTEFTGGAFLRDNDPTQGAFEFQITQFSSLYNLSTGIPLATDTVIRVGGFAGSNDDFIDEEFVPSEPVNFGLVPPTPPPVVCPPLSPPIQINPHELRHINTAHPTLVRVYVQGTSGFDVSRILPETVRFGGAAPVGSFIRNTDGDEFPDATYIFRGDQLNLPPGQSMASVTGQYLDVPTGHVVNFESARIVFNKTFGDYTPRQLDAQQRRLERFPQLEGFPTPALAASARAAHVDLALDQLGTASTRGNRWSGTGRATVGIPTDANRSARLAELASSAEIRRSARSEAIDTRTDGGQVGLATPPIRLRPASFPNRPTPAPTASASTVSPAQSRVAARLDARQNAAIDQVLSTPEPDYLDDLAASLAV